MADRRADDAGRGVGDQGEGEDVHPGVPGDDRLGHGGHPDDVGPERGSIRISAGVS